VAAFPNSSPNPLPLDHRTKSHLVTTPNGHFLSSSVTKATLCFSKNLSKSVNGVDGVIKV